MNAINVLIKKTADKMNKPFTENLLHEPLMSLNIGYTAIEVMIFIKIISDSANINYIDVLDSIAGEDITYNSIYLSVMQYTSKI